MSVYALAQAGDPDALAALVRQHIPLVQALNRRFSFSEDAFQQGCIGLVTAIRRFREELGNQFSTYAVPIILGEMRHAFSHSLGWRARSALRRVQAFREEALQRTGREPAIRETAAAAGLQPEELMLLMERDQPNIYDETGTLLSSIPDPRGDSWLLRLCIQDIFSRMSPEEQWLLHQRFLNGKSQTEIARGLHVPQYQVSRWEKRAKARFRQAWKE